MVQVEKKIKEEPWGPTVRGQEKEERPAKDTKKEKFVRWERIRGGGLLAGRQRKSVNSAKCCF